jgi:putative S-adenosyl-L-methionine-dependent methyltransferase
VELVGDLVVVGQVGPRRYYAGTRRTPLPSLAVAPLVPAAYELVERARRLGPLPYSALGPTAAAPMPPPEELAAWTAGALDEIWEAEEHPDPFTYVDVGAGDGTRARELLGLGPECLSALRVVLVEEDPSLRERHAENLSIEAPALTLGPVAPSDDPDEGSRSLPGVGPLVTSLTDLPVLATASVAIVIAFGWLSRQPADRFMWQDGTWWELRLGALGDDGNVLTEINLPLDEARAATMDEVASGRVDGACYASPVGAVEWLKSALATAETGWLLAVDRWTAKTEPLAGDAPAVALDQIAAVRQPASGPVPVAESLEVVRWRLG